MGDLLNPFTYLGSLAAKIVADGWTAAMLGLWNAGLWLLRLALSFSDFLLTPDLRENGPGAHLYRVTFWIAATLLLIMGIAQLGIAASKRDGRGLVRVAVGFGQFVVVWAGWIGYGVTLVAACSGLTRALMGSLLNVTSWSAWRPWTPFTPADITDGTIATVLGLMGLLLVVAAIGHLLVLLARAASLMVLAATTPIAAAGLVSDAGRAWFWKSLRWFHAAALSPVLMVLVLGVGVQFTTGVANGLTGTKLEAAIGTAVPGVILICVAVVSPLALYKLLAFVDPGTTSGAALRASMAATGGLQNLLAGYNPAGSTNAGAGTSATAAAGDDSGRSAGEQGAANATSGRFAAATQQLLRVAGPAGQVAATGLGWMTSIGGAGAAVGADLTNQMGVGHNTYPPDFTLAARRATTNGGSNDGGSGDSGGTPPSALDPPPADMTMPAPPGGWAQPPTTGGSGAGGGAGAGTPAGAGATGAGTVGSAAGSSQAAVAAAAL